MWSGRWRLRRRWTWRALRPLASSLRSGYTGGVLPAVVAIQERARRTEAQALERIDRALTEAGLDVAAGDLLDEWRAGMVGPRITLNFHPDRIAADGLTVADGLRRSGRYRPQIETGISNGGRTAVSGGDRHRWEAELFASVYAETDDVQANGAAPSRPVYGALDLTVDPHGGSPRFGSSFVVVAPAVWERTTFCVGDSHLGPTDVGTLGAFAPILAGLLESGLHGDGLGRSLSARDLVAALKGELTTSEPARCLDSYIEAQIHGGVSLADVTTIVLDPSFRATAIAESLEVAASSFGFSLGYHHGSELKADDVPGDFRGPAMIPLAAAAARPDGVIDAASIGRRARTIPFTAPSSTGDDPDSERQRIKQLWHCLLRFGSSAR